MKKLNGTMKKNQNSLYGKLVTEFESGDFMPMDFCQLCGKYDTIQTYVTFKGKFIHICEDCSYYHFGPYRTKETLKKLEEPS